MTSRIVRKGGGRKQTQADRYRFTKKIHRTAERDTQGTSTHIHLKKHISNHTYIWIVHITTRDDNSEI